MVSIDTNVLVRFLTDDDADQGRRARALIAAESVFPPLTVCLDTEWFLRSFYGFSATRVTAGLRFFSAAERHGRGPQRLMLALDRMDQGMDFAALHDTTRTLSSSLRRFVRRQIDARSPRRAEGTPSA